MGPKTYENVGKSQPVLSMINPVIFTRTRTSMKGCDAAGPAYLSSPAMLQRMHGEPPSSEEEERGGAEAGAEGRLGASGGRPSRAGVMGAHEKEEEESPLAPTGEPNRCLNDAPCPPFIRHGASMRQPFDAALVAAGGRGGDPRADADMSSGHYSASGAYRSWLPQAAAPAPVAGGGAEIQLDAERERVHRRPDRAGYVSDDDDDGDGGGGGDDDIGDEGGDVDDDVGVGSRTQPRLPPLHPGGGRGGLRWPGGGDAGEGRHSPAANGRLLRRDPRTLVHLPTPGMMVATRTRLALEREHAHLEFLEGAAAEARARQRRANR
jgi:hypothetical protein